ncbi:unnamed protein product [Pseudo-nitzschia multistriata]|uniref:Uncharacterized protein n=1 Tax=Pseudo-nitzschia multistriata TaxID=183589 RepID=A0A448YYZ8_9STRA|nr:unnamed protein product [Pseudo-nitzschia multistriata]
MIIPAFVSCSWDLDGGGDDGGDAGEIGNRVGETSIASTQKEWDVPLEEERDNVPVDRVPPGDDGGVGLF